MLSAFAKAFKTPDLRIKIFFTLAIMALFRLGSVIPTPGVSYVNVQECLKTANTGGLFGLINLFSGGALLQLSVFALGIMPYITSSIIVQLLTVVIPRFEALKKEGQSGTAKLTQYTRYLTIGLAVLQSTGLIAVARTPGRLISGCSEAIIPDTSWQRIVTMIFVMTAGTSVIMWLGELITDRGVGNGMSILIFTSIAASFPGQLWSIKLSRGWPTFLFILAVGILIVAAVVTFLALSGGSSQAVTFILPDVTSMSLDEAVTTLEDLGLSVVPEAEETNSVDDNIVWKQIPNSGESVRDGDSITVVYNPSNTPIPVPNLTGLTIDQARTALFNLGLTIGIVTPQNDPTAPENILKENGRGIFLMLLNLPLSFSDPDPG